MLLRRRERVFDVVFMWVGVLLNGTLWVLMGGTFVYAPQTQVQHMRKDELQDEGHETVSIENFLYSEEGAVFW